MSRRILLNLALLFGATALLLTACSSPQADALKLFEKGEFEAVIQKYPDLEIARRARAKIADRLILEKKFDVVLRDYADTPAAWKARNARSQELYDAGRYQVVVDSFPGSPVWAASRDRIVDSLITVGQTDTLFKRYADAPRVTQLKDSLSNADLAKANNLKGAAKVAAMDELIKKWPGTTAYKEAARIVQEARAKK